MVKRSSAVRVGGCQCPRDAGERHGLPGVAGDGLGDAFRAVRVGGCQCPAMRASAQAFEESSVMDWAMRSARSGSVAASAPATMASALAFQSSR